MIRMVHNMRRAEFTCFDTALAGPAQMGFDHRGMGFCMASAAAQPRGCPGCCSRPGQRTIGSGITIENPRQLSFQPAPGRAKSRLMRLSSKSVD